MWSSRRSSTAAPSIDSQTSRKRVSSSDQENEKPSRLRDTISMAMTAVINSSIALHNSSTARHRPSVSRLTRSYMRLVSGDGPPP